MSRFAAETEVPVSKSRAELETLLERNGATQRATYVDDDEGKALVQFRMGGRMARLEVKVPKLEDYWPSGVKVPKGWNTWTADRRTDWVRARFEQGARTAWRRLLLVTKAKLEIIADGGSTFEREFLADILLPDGRTVHSLLAEQLDESYKTGGMPKLLPPGGG